MPLHPSRVVSPTRDVSAHPTPIRRGTHAAVLGLLLSMAVPSVALAQGPPQPWPQRGDTTSRVDTVNQSTVLTHGDTLVKFDSTLTYPFFGYGEKAGEDLALKADNDATAPDSTKPDAVPDSTLPDTLNVDWDSWDIPGDTDFDSTLTPSAANYRVGHNVLTSCPSPISGDCTTGGTIVGKTYGLLGLELAFAPHLTIMLDTVKYRARAHVIYPVPGSFAPGDTITIGSGFRLDSNSTFVTTAQLDGESATLILSDSLRARLSMTACLLGACATKTVLRTKDSTRAIDQHRTFDLHADTAAGLTGYFRLPRVNLTESQVDSGRIIRVSGQDDYASLDWDPGQYVCSGCLAGTVPIGGTSVDYRLLAMKLHTDLAMSELLGVRPAVFVRLHFHGVALQYVVRTPSNQVVASGTDSTIAFKVGNSVSLVVPDTASNPSHTLIMQPVLHLVVNSVHFQSAQIFGPVRRSLTALQATYHIPSATLLGLTFPSHTFTLGPASASAWVSDSEAHRTVDINYPLSLPDSMTTVSLPPDTLTPELPSITTTFNPALPPPNAAPRAAGGGIQAAPAAAGGDLVQPLTVVNAGNVNLGSLAVDYALRTVQSDSLVAQGQDVATQNYLQMLKPMQAAIPLRLEDVGRAYQLAVTVRAQTPIGTALAPITDLTIGMYGVDIGPVTGASTVTVTVHSSAELDAKSIDPASVTLAGVTPTSSSLTTANGLASLVLEFPRDSLVAAAKALATASLPKVTGSQLVGALLGQTSSLSQTEIDLMDRLGNDNGRLDVGDVRAYLVAAGDLPAAGADSVGDQPSGTTTVPVTLLLSGVMNKDQRAYGLGILLLPGGGS